jgi:hypothetical protein
MARARSGGGGSGSAWGLVIFGAGFFISLVMAIIFMTQVSGARQGEQEAKKALAAFASPTEQNAPEIAALTDGGGSVVGALLKERAWLRSTISQDPEKSRPELETGLKNLGIEGRALFQEIKRLQNDFAALDQLKSTLEEELAKARQRADEAEKAKADLDKNYNDSLARLDNTMGETTAALDATQDRIKEQASTLETQMADARGESRDLVGTLEERVREKDTEIARLLRVIDELTGGGNQDPGPGNLTQADGRIVSLIGGRNEVYISLGKSDHLLMGMTFEVFDDNELVKLDNYENVRGKATIEVVSVDEGASVARIVRRERGQTVKDNDVIVNLAYDPESVYKFHVYGDFDLRGSGVASAEGRTTIESKIRQNGGRISDDLTYDVDYLVLGSEPPLPTAPPEGEVDPVKIAIYVREQQDFETYQQLVGEARSLDIPVLNQNRFLALMGLYDR